MTVVRRKTGYTRVRMVRKMSTRRKDSYGRKSCRRAVFAKAGEEAVPVDADCDETACLPCTRPPHCASGLGFSEEQL